MHKLTFVLGGFSLAGLLYFVGTTLNEQAVVLLSCALPLIGFVLSVMPRRWTIPENTNTFRTEQGYLIRTKKAVAQRVGKDYPMVVSYETMQKAMSTGDYAYEGPATGNEAGDHYLNDGTGGTGSYVPPGHIAVEKSCYQDERLNE